MVPNPSQSHYEQITGAGHVGWCATARTADAHSAGRIYGCSPAVSSKESARIAGGSLGLGAQRVTFVVVDERVAGVRLRDGRIIEPRSDTSLPGDWRAAIWSGGTDTPTTVDLLNAHGQELPAKGQTTQGLSTVQPAGPLDSVDNDRCAITSTSLAVGDARAIIDEPQASPELPGQPFLICGTARIGEARDTMGALVLLDARNPGSPPAMLPGATPSPTDPDIVEVGPDASAHRRADAWLVVTSAPIGGKAKAQQRAKARHRTLAALEIGR